MHEDCNWVHSIIYTGLSHWVNTSLACESPGRVCDSAPLLLVFLKGGEVAGVPSAMVNLVQPSETG